MTRQLGLVLHHYRDDVRELARQAIDWAGTSVEVRLPKVDAELIGHGDLGVSEDEFASELDCCLSLGGDGTMLRSARLVSADGVPILGINGGRLGYLAEIEPAHMLESLDGWRNGDLQIEERMMLEVSTVGASGKEVVAGRALNEAVVYRSDSGRTLEVLATIGGKPFTNYLADGVIVATPTGSTAYSLSAGGPIVEPDFQALLVTPVAAHMVFDRSMVLAPTTEVQLTVQGHRGGRLSLDGRTVVDLQPGITVVCRASATNARFFTTQDRDFHTVLKEKFHLIDRRDDS